MARVGVVKGSTALNTESLLKKHIIPPLGRKKLIDIEKREIVKLQQNLAENYKDTTVNEIITKLKLILNDAVRDDIIEKSPASGIRPLKVESQAASETIHRALTEQEQKEFMEYAKGEWLYEFFAFLLCTGMRFGEASALTWQDIDQVNNVIRVTKTVSRTAEGKPTIGSPKSKTSTRDIPLTEDVKYILKSQKGKLNLIHGNVINLSQRVFESVNGRMLYNRNANQAIERVLDKMVNNGLEIERFSLHAFRDTFATRYIEQGGSPQILKTILGHSSLAMTMDLYSHVLPNKKQEEMNSIKIAF